MKNKYIFIISCIIALIGCTSNKQKREKSEQQIMQDSIILAEKIKSPILKEFEKVEKNGGQVMLSTFLQTSCIADNIISNYGGDYYNFALQCLKNYTTPVTVITEEQSYTMFACPDDNSGTIVLIQYDKSRDSLEIHIEMFDSTINPDGSFALKEGSKWEKKYLEYDEFGDPVTDKPYIVVGSTNSKTTEIGESPSVYIAILKGDEEHVLLDQHEIMGVTTFLDRIEVISITVKDKNTGEIFPLTNYTETSSWDHILSLSDSKRIIDMCNKKDCDFAIQYKTRNYCSDWFSNAEEYNVTTVYFENGAAYGVMNAICAYFYKAF